MIKVTILGCGSSGGVPRCDGEWGECDPNNPKNYRTRCSILVDKYSAEFENPTRVLIDTSPDLRTQFLANKVKFVDAVLFTHDHADQTHGIDDLRPIVYINRKRIDAYIDAETSQSLIPKFGYVFKGHEKGSYPALLNHIEMPADGEYVNITGQGGAIDFLVLSQKHGEINSLGFRFNNIAYCNDTNGLPKATLDRLYGLDMLIIDALRYTEHPSHANLDMALAWIEELKPKKALLTNLHIDMDYDTLCHKLPSHIRPAYDNLSFMIEDAANY